MLNFKFSVHSFFFSMKLGIGFYIAIDTHKRDVAWLPLIAGTELLDFSSSYCSYIP